MLVDDDRIGHFRRIEMGSFWLWEKDQKMQTPQCRYLVNNRVFDFHHHYQQHHNYHHQDGNVYIENFQQPTFIASWSKSKEIKRARRLFDQNQNIEWASTSTKIWWWLLYFQDVQVHGLHKPERDFAEDDCRHFCTQKVVCLVLYLVVDQYYHGQPGCLSTKWYMRHLWHSNSVILPLIISLE